MKYLGIDYGKRRIGLSISEGMLASPFKTLTVNSLQDAVAQVRALIEKEQIDQLVVGIPESGESLTMVQKFITLIKPQITVVQVAETLSSQQAESLAITLGKSQSDRKDNDALAATLILQEYLDTHE